MPLVLRLALCAVLLTALAGCGNKHETRSEGETEAAYLDLGGLDYQVQISRVLNPADVEDRVYLQGLPLNTEPPQEDETWFAVFIRVQNVSENLTLESARDFEIIDTQEKVYRPIPVDPEANAFVYEPRDLAPGEVIPEPDSVVAESQIQGEMLLFKVRYDSLQNRPLEFKIHSDAGEALVDLDV